MRTDSALTGGTPCGPSGGWGYRGCCWLGSAVRSRVAGRWVARASSTLPQGIPAPSAVRTSVVASGQSRQSGRATRKSDSSRVRVSSGSACEEAAVAGSAADRVPRGAQSCCHRLEVRGRARGHEHAHERPSSRSPRTVPGRPRYRTHRRPTRQRRHASESAPRRVGAGHSSSRSQPHRGHFTTTAWRRGAPGAAARSAPQVAGVGVRWSGRGWAGCGSGSGGWRRQPGSGR